MLTGLICGAAAAALAPHAWAAEAAPRESNALEEVVVTARRTAELQQTVPVAITTFSQAALERNQIHSLADLQQYVPSATVSGYQNRNQEFFTLRGQGETGLAVGGGVGGGPAVVGYLAEVPAPIAGPGLYYDLASVQVLKGPQGTLFGRNTTGGAILFEPRLPSFSYGGYVEGTVGDYGRREAMGAVDLPLVDDKLAVRLAGQIGRRDGYTTDVVSGVDYDNRNFRAARGTILFQPNDRVKDVFIANYVDYKEHGPGEILIAANPAVPALIPYFQAQQARGVRETELGMHELNQGRFYNLINKTDFALSDTITLRNIVSYSRRSTRRQDDEDGTPLPILDSVGSEPGTWNIDLRTITEEVQLRGKSADGRLDWQLGGYFEDIRNPGPQTFTQNQGPGFFVHTKTDSQSDSKAVYGQVTYALDGLVEGLKATAGYRYTWDHIYTGTSIFGGASARFQPTDTCFIGPDLAHCFSDAQTDNSGSSYNLGLEYQAHPGLLIYATARQGFKQGGFNLISSLLGDRTLFAYKPEYVDDIEVGLKADWDFSDVRGRTNIALYDSRYRDAQVLSAALVAGTVQGITVNAARATIRGAEIENIVRPVDGVELNLTYSYLDAGYDKYVTPLGLDLTNSPYPYAPKNKLVVGGRVRLPLAPEAGELWLGANYAYQSSMYVGITAFGASPVSTEPGYGLLNLRADWNGVLGSPVDLSVFVTNATDKVYETTVEDLYNANGASIATFGEPRMFGATLRYSF